MLNDHMARGLLPYYKIGRLVRVRRGDLDAWIEAGRVEAHRDGGSGR